MFRTAYALPAVSPIPDGCLRRTVWHIKKQLYRPSFGRVDRLGEYRLIELGTDKGGWRLLDKPELHQSTIISCGLRTDASFDVAFASYYNARLLIVDSAPQVIRHVQALQTRAGQESRRPYSKHDNLHPLSYDLRNVAAEQIVLIPKSLSSQAPNGLGVCVETILQEHDVATPPVVKLDSDGSEIEVVHDLLGKGILPGQFLIAYDELGRPGARSKARINGAHQALLEHGYRLVYRNPYNRFSYAQVRI